ncbi:MAG TPA: GDP-mannose 4,6-dehydratase [Solirubrobacteraceae bacterium]|nr:GDP-mannose 4,6-dehydratase [Solirubrobacteraceae bacterium]
MPAHPRRALITGISGQDGSFLAELLLEKGYEVTGLVHGEPTERSLGCSEHLCEQLTLLGGDLLEPESLTAAILQARPHELYHLASPSFIPASWERPAETMRAIVGSTAALLEAVRTLKGTPQAGAQPDEAGVRVDEADAPQTRIWVAASGAIFGNVRQSPQDESTPCRPTSPYAIAKLASHQLVGAMRAHDGLYACSGIVFNHESERRPPRFVTRTVTRAAAQIKLGLAEEVRLGELSAVRDWSFAGDVMYGAWLMLQQERPADYVLASGVGHTVGEFARAAFACVGLEAERYIRVDPKLVRAPEPTPSVGDPSRAREQLGWQPRLSFEQLVERMVEADMRELQAVAGLPACPP